MCKDCDSWAGKFKPNPKQQTKSTNLKPHTHTKNENLTKQIKKKKNDRNILNPQFCKDNAEWEERYVFTLLFFSLCLRSRLLRWFPFQFSNRAPLSHTASHTTDFSLSLPDAFIKSVRQVKCAAPVEEDISREREYTRHLKCFATIIMSAFAPLSLFLSYLLSACGVQVISFCCICVLITDISTTQNEEERIETTSVG